LEHWLSAGLARLLVGYPIVIAIRIVGKSLLSKALVGCGVDVKDGASNDRPRSSDQAGAALVKVVTYHLMSAAITYFVPILLRSLSLVSFPLLDHITQ
jgi:hypothetical protein